MKRYRLNLRCDEKEVEVVGKGSEGACGDVEFEFCVDEAVAVRSYLPVEPPSTISCQAEPVS